MRKRKAAESIEAQKYQMIAALYSNPNWDEKDAKRPEQIKEIETHFTAAVNLIYDPDSAKATEQEIDWSNPFWMAAKRSHEKALAAHPELRKKQVGDVIEMDADQLEARARSRKEIDQIGMADR